MTTGNGFKDSQVIVVKKELEKVRRSIDTLKKKQSSLLQELAELHAKFAIGDRVTNKRYTRQNQVFEIVRLTPAAEWLGFVNYVARLVLKDGTLGKNFTTLWNYKDDPLFSVGKAK